MTRTTDLDTCEDRQSKRRRAVSQSKDDGFVTKLEAARNALALVGELPEITELIDARQGGRRANADEGESERAARRNRDGARDRSRNRGSTPAQAPDRR